MRATDPVKSVSRTAAHAPAYDLVGDGRHALREDRLTTTLHPLGTGTSRCVREHDCGYARRGMDGEPLRNHSAKRQAAEREPFDPERICERQHVLSELVDRILARRHGGCAVTADVVAHHAEALRERGCLRVPHAVILAERVRQEQRRHVLAAMDAIETALGSVLEDRHRLLV
jgi:hypothetical protein